MLFVLYYITSYFWSTSGKEASGTEVESQMSAFIRIRNVDGRGRNVERDFVKTLVSRSYSRGDKPILTTAYQGYYYAIISDGGDALNLQASLFAVGVTADVVDQLPGAVRQVAQQPRSSAPQACACGVAGCTSIYHDKRVREAAAQAAVRLFGPTFLFGPRR
jgi:hypothetical protein